jgi:polysaccharide pyruvyl transferase WcaK-like protein
MSTDETDRPILLLGAYGRGNAGDDVFILSAVNLFKHRTLYINSADDILLPHEAKERVETISTTNARDLLKKIRLLLKIKTVVYWGGDLWVELYGTKVPRQLLYKMVFANALLRFSGKRIYYVGCGIGDLHGFSRWLARLSGRMAKSIVVREHRSARILGLPSTQVLPDLAINLPFNKTKQHALPSSQPFSIVISVLWSIPDPEQNFPKLIRHIADLINNLPTQDFKITLLPMHLSDAEFHDDMWASQQLAKYIKKQGVEVFTIRNLRSITKLLRDCHLVIGTRLHSNILAILNGTPAIGIAYRPKVKSFFTDNQLDDYCLGLDNLENLTPLFHTIYQSYDHISKLFSSASERNLSKRADYEAFINEL